ncbi:MAG TPA: hypothetical protein VKT73_08980 [Xanthobacteraceae bacterium]|nr:hypothetical protein [Xanthobacteraceae bacterium]
MPAVRTALCVFTLLASSAAAYAQIGFTGIGGSAPGFAPPPAATTPPPSPPPPQSRTATPVVAPSAAPQPAPLAPAIGPRDPHAFVPQVAQGKVALAVAARYSSDGPYIPRAMNWRVFAERPDGGPPVAVAEAQDAYPVFALDPGNYIVHASYGLASDSRRIQLTGETRKETFIIPAGGLRVQGKIGDLAIPPQRLRFDVYEGSFLQRGPVNGRSRKSERPPVLRGASGGDLVFLPAGTYYVQSTYGDGNAQIQADVRIEPGRLTDATVHHRAAQITLRLVNVPGGEAIANTQWTVVTPGGDSIRESTGAFPSVVLAEGEYIAVARHIDKTCQQPFKVQSGNDREIEVLTAQCQAANTARQ